MERNENNDWKHIEDFHFDVSHLSDQDVEDFIVFHTLAKHALKESMTKDDSYDKDYFFEGKKGDSTSTIALDLVEVQPCGGDLPPFNFPEIDWIEFKDLPSNYNDTSTEDWKEYYKQGGDDLAFVDIRYNVKDNEDKRTYVVNVGEVYDDNAEVALGELMKSYKQDIEFNEETGEVIFNEEVPFPKDYWMPIPNEEYSRIGYLDNSVKDEEITWDNEKGSITVNGKALNPTDKVYWCPTKYDSAFNIGNIGIGMDFIDIKTYGDAGQVQINGKDLVAKLTDVIYKGEFISDPKGIEVIDEMIYIASVMAGNIMIDCEDPRKEDEILNYLSKFDLNTKQLAKQLLTHGTLSYEKVYRTDGNAVIDLKRVEPNQNVMNRVDLNFYPNDELNSYSDMMHIAYFELGLHKFDYTLNCSITNASYVEHEYYPNLAQQAFIKQSFLESNYFNISDSAKDIISNSYENNRFVDMLQASIIEFYYDVIRSDERFKYYNFSLYA